MSEDPRARPRKQVCIQRGAGFRQEKAGQGLPARVQRNASCPLHPPPLQALGWEGVGTGDSGDNPGPAWRAHRQKGGANPRRPVSSPRPDTRASC